MNDAQLIAQARATVAARKTPLREWVRARIGSRWRPARHLEQLYALYERAERETVRACVSMPPGAAKTDTMLACLSWLMARTPGDVHGYVSYNGPATRSKSSKLRDWCRETGMVAHPELDSLSDWRNITGGGLIASGVGGRLTGDRVTGVLGIDDPFKNPAQATNVGEQLRRLEWFNAVAWTRIVPETGSVIVEHTRWDPGDLIGRLSKVTDLDGRALWEVICIPAIDDAGESYWPEVYPLVELLLRKAQLDAETPYLWDALYLQNPKQRGGKLFHGEPACYQGTEPGQTPRCIIGVDIAVTVKQSGDKSAAVVTDNYRSGVETVTDVRDVQTWRAESPVTIERLHALQVAHPGSALAFEVSGVGKPVCQHYKSQYPGAKVIEITRVSDKAAAAIGTATAFRQGRVRYPISAPWRREHLGRLHDFTGAPGAEDDDVDALINAREAAVRGGATYSANFNL